ncbi:16S rRNA (guanine(527)-N(7))-methyltransferase RsmG [Amaricoccus solimangrovi]|uniref:Ribosomal RNA small subunit methyltransferase G n=1 Tax=Amaricoccus solimangrovi TaxID=2589815 RepID=A0A501WWN7_9RHOB|nr:16S rRNA (guanine(527)-N(7))-methyltransferase RsmG [Amaricoccus solimangrovi]TPE52554.1 16S rRNA (guanine(527)-N(7))-methyltransferase RsmG [Amaricoccus solimangrovi]
MRDGVPLDVSRETQERLERYAELLTKWTARINLVSKASLSDLWTRHIADSAQLWTLAPADPAVWCDIGSGGGFPGLVIGILARERQPDLDLHLVESDTRKCAFLSTVIRECGLRAVVHAERIEEAMPPAADVLSARALAPLPALLAFAEKLRRPEGICLFPKGEQVHKELEDAACAWQFEYHIHPSRTDEKAAIVEIGAFARV